ncbi:hypothetical protein K0M31_018411 [Melipona bicolor]|uniref:Uncharacterized protein n=1 Tax=Melipona bicolor TaxID=60889 RepID=A0AA40G3E8_9HYME|nr:hypothetical protein K0M31_018411 [Melipona bicolor]
MSGKRRNRERDQTVKLAQAITLVIGSSLGGEDSVEISNRALGRLNTRRNINSDKTARLLNVPRDLRLRRSCNLPCNFSSIRLARLLPPSEGLVSWDGGWERCRGVAASRWKQQRQSSFPTSLWVRCQRVARGTQLLEEVFDQTDKYSRN